VVDVVAVVDGVMVLIVVDNVGVGVVGVPEAVVVVVVLGVVDVVAVVDGVMVLLVADNVGVGDVGVTVVVVGVIGTVVVAVVIADVVGGVVLVVVVEVPTDNVVVLVATQLVAISLIPSTTSFVVFNICLGDVNQNTVEFVGLEAIIVSNCLLQWDVKPTMMILTPVDCNAEASDKVCKLSK